MPEISKFKTEYELIFEGLCRKEDIVLFCETDIAGDMEGGVTLISVTREYVFAVSGYFTITDSENAGIKTSRKSVRNFVKTGLKTFKTNEITDIKAEELISTVRLIVSADGMDTMLAIGSFAAKTDMLLLVKYLRRFIENPEETLIGDETDFSPKLFCPKCGKRYINPLTKKCAACDDTLSMFKKLWVLVKKYRAQIIIMLLAYAVVSGIGAVSPYFSSAFFYDRVILNQNDKFYGKILLVVLIVAGVNIASMLVNMLTDIINAKIGGNIVYDLKITIFDAMKKLSLDFFTSRQTGGLMTQINDDANSIYWFFTGGLTYFITNGVQIIAVSIIMLCLNWKLAVFCIAVLPIFLWLVMKIMTIQKSYHYRSFSARRRFNSRLTDSLSAIKVTKAFARENDECKKFETVTLGAAKATQDMVIFNNVYPPLIRTFMFLTRLFIWCLGGWLVINGKLTYGFFTAFIAYADMLNSPLYSIADMMNQLADCVTATQRLFEIYDAEPSVAENMNPVQKGEIKGDIEFKNVSFSYDRSRKVIDNVSFSVKAGQKLGIVGHSGAGKSTLANLLIRLYDVGAGEILIDGVNVRDMEKKLLRDNVSIVSQETYLFSGTIYDNIAYARSDATRDEVIEAARMAGAHDFISKLTDGYQTKVGKGEKGLSGGEMQRISIARAILKNPKILILDEATASMDTKTERMIQLSLDKLSENRTTIMIAHRLSTLKNVDGLIVIEDGRLVQAGTHAELMAEEGVYRTLYNLQLAALVNVIEEDNHDRRHHGKSFRPLPPGPGGKPF